MAFGVLEHLPLQLLFILSLFLLFLYQKEPVLRFLIVFHLLSMLVEFFWLQCVTNPTVPQWHYQQLLLSNTIKVLIMLVCISLRFKLLCHTTLLVLMNYGLVIVLQLVGLYFPVEGGLQDPVFEQVYVVLSQMLQIIVMLVLLYPAIHQWKHPREY